MENPGKTREREREREKKVKKAGMAENINACITMTVEEFEEGLKKLSKIKPEEALEYLDDAMIYFNHHIVDGKIVQASNTNCVNVVQKVDEFLKTGKISKAAASGAQEYYVLEKLYTTFPQ
ncbi:hypothetical protein CHRYSEOSP005_02620 [Chryseobacterium sp. Alg-005]|uniref:hypothetical protein n=1 Tax=Chryseobacterium sp. Alg-005 TaxID=3159516 RepID=UPI003555909F